jgi:hypothetical protein
MLDCGAKSLQSCRSMTTTTGKFPTAAKSMSERGSTIANNTWLLIKNSRDPSKNFSSQKTPTVNFTPNEFSKVFSHRSYRKWHQSTRNCRFSYPRHHARLDPVPLSREIRDQSSPSNTFPRFFLSDSRHRAREEKSL